MDGFDGNVFVIREEWKNKPSNKEDDWGYVVLVNFQWIFISDMW